MSASLKNECKANVHSLISFQSCILFKNRMKFNEQSFLMKMWNLSRRELILLKEKNDTEWFGLKTFKILLLLWDFLVLNELMWLLGFSLTFGIGKYYWLTTVVPKASFKPKSPVSWVVDHSTELPQQLNQNCQWWVLCEIYSEKRR